jgi:hypothetical protein
MSSFRKDTASLEVITASNYRAVVLQEGIHAYIRLEPVQLQKERDGGQECPIALIVDYP